MFTQVASGRAKSQIQLSWVQVPQLENHLALRQCGVMDKAF